MVTKSRALATLVLVVAALRFAGEVRSLADVRTIYVEQLGNKENADLIREKLINRLVETPEFSVIEKREKADAILKGMGFTEKHDYVAVAAGVGAAAGVRFDATVVLRLVSQEGVVLWTGEAKPGSSWGPTRSVTSSVADKIIKQLRKAAKKSKKTRR